MFRASLPIYYAPSFSSYTEAESGAEVYWEGGIAEDFVVAAVEGVRYVRVGCDAGVDGVPSAEIDANVSGGVVDSEAIEI
jgi:hypothetical protein